MASSSRRRSSAYAPAQGLHPSDAYQPNPNPNYDPGAPTVAPTSVPYGPTQPVVVDGQQPPVPVAQPQPQHPGMRRPSSYQPTPSAPIAVPQRSMPGGGVQQTMSYEPSASQAVYGTSPVVGSYSSSHSGASPYGTSPASHPSPGYAHPVPVRAPPQAQAYASSYPPPTSMPPANGYAPAPPPPNGYIPAQPTYTDRYDPAYASPPHSTRRHSHTSPRRPSHSSDHPPRVRRHSTYEYENDAYQDPHTRRHSRNDSYEDDYGRRRSKSSVHSKSSKSSKGGKKYDKRPTYGDSVMMAWGHARDFFSSERK